MKYSNCTYTRYFGQTSLVSLLGFILLGASASAVAQSFPDMGYCTNCSTAGFAWAAEHATPSVPGSHPVYVVDTASGEVRYFDVEVWWDCGGNNPQAGNPGHPRGIPRTEPTLQSNCIQKEAIPGSGDGLIKLAIQDARFMALEFVHFVSSAINIGDIPGAEHIESAIDLVGPGSAGVNRNAVQNGLNDLYSSFWHSLLVNASDLAHNALNRIFENQIFDPAKPIWVQFPDGTEIRVNVDDYHLTGFTVDFTLSVDTDSAHGLPGLGSVPQSGGEFHNYNFEGSSNLGLKLLSLANRFGSISCQFTCNPGGDSCSLTCIHFP